MIINFDTKSNSQCNFSSRFPRDVMESARINSSNSMAPSLKKNQVWDTKPTSFKVLFRDSHCSRRRRERPTRQTCWGLRRGRIAYRFWWSPGFFGGVGRRQSDKAREEWGRTGREEDAVRGASYYYLKLTSTWLAESLSKQVTTRHIK